MRSATERGDAVKAQRKRILVLAAAAAALAAVGVTMAFMFRKAGAENQFAPAEVMCGVQEQLNDDTYTFGSHVGDVKSNIRVKNTGTYPAYVRVRLVSSCAAAGWPAAAAPTTAPSQWRRGT